MNKNNKSLKDIFAEAYQNYQKKDFKKAEVICYKILNIDPHNFDSIFLLATISATGQNWDKAVELLFKANEIQPNNITVYNNIGTAFKELGKTKEAINYYEKALKINSNHTNANYNLGLIYYGLKDLKKSKNYLQKTVEIQKNYAIAFFSLANVHVELKELEHAVSCYQKAIEINPNHLASYNNLGLVFRSLNDFKNAVSCYQKVIKIKPDYVGAHHNLALAFKELGSFNESIKSHETAIKYEPENLVHYYYLSELKREILDDNLKNKIQKTLENKNCTKNNAAYGNFLLAKYERLTKEYKNEINFLTKGHQNFFELKKEKFTLGVKYCFEDVLKITEGAKIEKTVEKQNYKIKPIFIIGVPRCGSTVVEKIIASGDKLIPIGEETAVLENYVNAKILEKQSLNLGSEKEIREEISSIYKNKGLISEKYGNIFTDKSLNNFFYLEIIKDVYPGAKIINCKRNVISSIVSIYQNNLTELAWAHDLKNIFKYFENYFNIIDNFNETYPNYIYELQFENLVNNPEEESKKLMEYCELPWNKNCLEFYKRKDLISKTASNVQIRKAIFKHSPEKYLPYKKILNEHGENYTWFN